MSDIGINITPWAIAWGMLAMAFWPLTTVAAAALLWLLRQRASMAARIVTVVALVLWSGSAVTTIMILVNQAQNAAAYRASLRARQTTLAKAATVDGMRLPAGTVVTRGSTEFTNDVAAIDVPHTVAIGGIPIVGHAGIADARLDGDVTLAADVRIGQAWCSAKAPARFDSGALTTCTLSRPSRIHGIPCSGSLDLQNGVVCTLFGDYQRYGIVWRTQTKVTDYGDLVWFHIGGVTPSLRLFAMPLTADAEVQFQNGRIASIDVRSKPVSFRGCSFDLILAQKGSLLGQTTGVCALPSLPPGYVPLPKESIAYR